MNVDLVITAHGKGCLVYDGATPMVPLWVRLHESSSEVELLLDSGELRRFPLPAAAELGRSLDRHERVLVVRLNQGEPCEGSEAYFMVVR